jgi:nucleotide-binding universal stress UspA family protein
VTAMVAKVLLAVDGSAQSRRALDSAVGIAKACGAAVTALCVYRHHSPLEASLSLVGHPERGLTPDEALREHAREIAGAAKEALLAAGLSRVEAHAKRGAPARTIVEFAEAGGFDLIVLGARGQGDAGGFFLGSVSHKVAGLAKTSCLIVKAGG